METPATSRKRRRSNKNGDTGEPAAQKIKKESFSEYEPPSSDVEVEDDPRDEDFVVGASNCTNLAAASQQEMDDLEDEEPEYTGRRRGRRGLSPLMHLLGVDDNKGSFQNFSRQKDTPYLAYDEAIWSPAHMYRLPSDITLQAIQSSGGQGVGRDEVGHKLMMDTSTKAGNRRVSAFIVNVCNDRKDYVGQYQKMDGKVRCIKYFWKASNEPENFIKLFAEFEKLTGKPCPFKMGQVLKFPNCNLNTLRISDVSLRRLNCILDILSKDPVVVTIHRVLKTVEDTEKAAGYQYSIDKKSLMKCMKALEEQRLLNMYETTVVSEGVSNKVQILCHASVKSVDDPVVSEYIEKTIDQYHKEGRVFPHGQLRYSVKKRGELQTSSEAVVSPEELIKNWNPHEPIPILDRFSIMRAMTTRATVIKSDAPEKEDKEESETPNTTIAEVLDDTMDMTVPKEDDTLDTTTPLMNLLQSEQHRQMFLSSGDVKRVVKLNVTMATEFGYQAKALRFISLHEVAYQLVHGHQLGTTPTYYDKFHLHRDMSQWPVDFNPCVYVDEESPLRFIPPLPPFKGLDRGWFMLQDFTIALPLSVFVLCAYVPKTIDKALIEEYLKDPIKRHICIGDLPNEIRIPILRDKKIYRQLEHTLLTLCAMGLMTVGQNPDPKRFVSAASSIFYVGTQGALYDTSTSARGYANVSLPLAQYDRYDYHFECQGDLLLYWHHLRAVVQSTPLSFRNDLTSNDVSLNRHKKYSLGLFDKALVTRSLSQPITTIEPLEPHDGCAGFDSALFLHLRRHWDLNPRPSAFVSWFIARFRRTSENCQSIIEKRVVSLQHDWNSFVKSMMPSDLDLSKTKRAMASSTTLYPSTRASIAIEPKSKTRLQHLKKSYEWRKKKRPLDSVDLVSEQSRIHVRSRFNAREKDMLILIRAVGFFLNPVYRFWLDPAVLRDIMHEYVPESRSKTVQSLMAAGVREMVRPNRLAYLQRIVRNLSTFQEMRNLRYQLATAPLVTPEAKTNFFKNAFDIANRLLFMDHQNLPHVTAPDVMFHNFLTTGEITISAEQQTSNPIPMRSRPPGCLEHVNHCMAINVLLGVLIHCNDGSFSERILEQLNATVIHNALQVLRSDGLVSRTRTLDPQLMVITKNQAVLSYYFRHFFAHRFHPDIIEHTSLLFDTFGHLVTEPAQRVPFEGDHVGLVIVASNAFYTRNDVEVDVDQQILTVFEEASLENSQQSTKQIRYLENADLHLERIEVSHVIEEAPFEVPDIKKLIKVIDRSHLKSDIDAASPLIFIKTFPDAGAREEMKMIYEEIKLSGALGIGVDEIAKKTGLERRKVYDTIQNLLGGHAIIEVGVDYLRWITIEHKDSWCITTTTDLIVSPKPWTKPNGDICLSTIRWMAESCMFTIVANAGITMKDLHFRYEFALQPAAVTDLVYVLERADCCTVIESSFPSMELSSPFDDDIPTTSCLYILPTVDCVERFSRLFSGVTLLSSMVSQTRDEDAEKPATPADSALDTTGLLCRPLSGTGQRASFEDHPLDTTADDGEDHDNTLEDHNITGEGHGASEEGHSRAATLKDALQLMEFSEGADASGPL